MLCNSPDIVIQKVIEMIDRIDEHPTPTNQKYFEKRGGKDRRKVHTMIDADKDRRKKNRRKRSSIKNP